MPGSDCYVGHCPKCGRINYEVTDCLCGNCELENLADTDEPTDEEADEFVSKFNERIDMRELANEILGSIATITTDYKNKH
jgi:hypothetical protein